MAHSEHSETPHRAVRWGAPRRIAHCDAVAAAPDMSERVEAPGLHEPLCGGQHVGGRVDREGGIVDAGRRSRDVGVLALLADATQRRKLREDAAELGAHDVLDRDVPTSARRPQSLDRQQGRAVLRAAS
jgi:hypothetical protein